MGNVIWKYEKGCTPCFILKASGLDSLWPSTSCPQSVPHCLDYTDVLHLFARWPARVCVFPGLSVSVAVCLWSCSSPVLSYIFFHWIFWIICAQWCVLYRQWLCSVSRLDHLCVFCSALIGLTCPSSSSPPSKYWFLCNIFFPCSDILHAMFFSWSPLLVVTEENVCFNGVIKKYECWALDSSPACCLYYLPEKERVSLEICLSVCVGLDGAGVYIGIFSGLALDGLWSGGPGTSCLGAPKVPRNASKPSFWFSPSLCVLPSCLTLILFNQINRKLTPPNI